jgi:hypothetical protein
MRPYTAIIVEPRQHPALSFVLNNFLNNLSDDWLIIIMHGTQNSDYIDDIIKNDLQKYVNRIAKINLFIENLTINQYNLLLTSEYFYKKIPTDTFLIFQTDTMINGKNKDFINKFLNYDYIGAPWLQNGNVGNGGLSLRKKQVCLNCIKQHKWFGNNEDMFFSEIIKNKPDFETAKLFAVETCYTDTTFGIHKPWFHLSRTELLQLIQEIDGLDELIRLNVGWVF